MSETLSLGHQAFGMYCALQENTIIIIIIIIEMVIMEYNCYMIIDMFYGSCLNEILTWHIRDLSVNHIRAGHVTWKKIRW